MNRTLIINSNNLVSNEFNNKYIYQFPTGAVVFSKNASVALTSISLYYSWFNVCSANTGGKYNNNSFEYTWIDGNSYTILYPDGQYSVEDLNTYFLSQMVANTHYLINSSTGSYIYYLEIISNSVYYACQINAYNVPTSGQLSVLGYNMPNNATWSLPSSSITPQITIYNTNNFGLLIGFDAGTYPTSPQSSSYSILSQNTPQISPITSLIVSCNLLQNSYSVPTTLLYSFSPNVSYGSLISILPPTQTFIPIQRGSYNQFEILFLDQNLNNVPINDTQICVMLTIKDEELNQNL